MRADLPESVPLSCVDVLPRTDGIGPLTQRRSQADGRLESPMS